MVKNEGADRRNPGTATAERCGPPLFLGSEIYRNSSYASWHPLRIPRVSLTIDLVRALGWLPASQYIDSPPATIDQLARFHDTDYIAAVIEAERTQTTDADTRRRFGLGVNGNPVYPEVFRRPATACGASIQAVALLRDVDLVYSPAGGTHHGRPNRASGFCYFNDPVLAILALQDSGIHRVAYVDLDAHHGDGVQDAFAEDELVLTISIHEDGRWPGTGLAEDRAGGMARNFPVPAGFNDAELAYILDSAVLPLVAAFSPEVVVVQGGADGLSEDPLSKLELSNGALWNAVRRLVGCAPKTIVLGGGGYNPWAVARCWAGIWGILNGYMLPSRLPETAEKILRGVEWRHRLARDTSDRLFTTLVDPPQTGPVRDSVKRIAEQAMLA